MENYTRVNHPFLIAMFMLVLLIGCGNSKEIERLTQENQSLQTENKAKEEFIEEYTDVFNKTVIYLEGLSGAHSAMLELDPGKVRLSDTGSISGVQSGMRELQSAGVPLEGVSPRERVAQLLNLVGERLDTSEQTRLELEEKIKTLEQLLQKAGLKKEGSAFQEWVIQLQATIEKKDKELVDLRNTVIVLRKERGEISEKLDKKIAEFNDMEADYNWLMNQCFVMIGSAKELNRHGKNNILDGTITLRLAKGLDETQFREHFQQVNRNTLSIPLGGNKKYVVRSQHKKYEGDYYRLIHNKDGCALEITNPNSFWRISPVLIVREGGFF